MTKFPIFVLIDGEIPVKIDQKNNEVFAVNGFNKPYPVLKAYNEGVIITQEEFNRFAKSLAA